MFNFAAAKLDNVKTKLLFEVIKLRFASAILSFAVTLLSFVKAKLNSKINFQPFIL
jgi:hypothetical protein